MQNKPFAIWGTGIEAVKIYYKLERDGYQVEQFFDNNIDENTYFLDKPVSKPNGEIVQKYYIFVGCKYYTYRSISDQLEQYGLEEMQDYIWYDLYKKKLVILHGNCHMDILRQYLVYTKEFAGGGYSLYPNELIQLNKKGFIADRVLQACAVMIQQDIREENAFGYRLSSDYITAKLDKSALNIVIPNLYGFGNAFFPHIINNKNNAPLRKSNEDTNGVFPRSIAVIDELLEQGVSEEKILEKLKSKQLLDKSTILNNFCQCVEKARIREKKCDVKIVDFIIKNYQSKKLFYDVGHPTNIIIEEKWRQICELMGIKAELMAEVYTEMDGYEDFILECVRNALEIQYEDIEIRKKTAWGFDEHISLEEYVKEYIWWRNKSVQGMSLDSRI